MIPKGIENANAIIESCRQTLAGLDGPDPEWREVLLNVVNALEELKTKFFLKTNLAIPATNACRKDAAELQALAEKRDRAGFPEALARFRGSIEKLFKQSDMDGIIIT